MGDSAGAASTVFVVDDDEGMRTAIRKLMMSAALPVTLFSCADDFLDLYQPSDPGCLVLDIRMPGMGGLELQDELRRRRAIIPIIFITGDADVSMAVEAMRHGAFDFIQKPFRSHELLSRVQLALINDLAARRVMVHRNELTGRLAQLTKRELQILRRLVDGQANKAIALDLGLSQRTIETHRAHIMEKMAAKSLAGLVKAMLELGPRDDSTP